MKDIAVRGVWYAAGLALGTVTAVAELFFALFAGLALLPVLAWPRGRRAVLRPVGAVAGRLTELERRRLRRFLAVTLAAAPEDGRGTRYLLARWPLGLLGGVVLGCALTGVAYGSFILWGWLVTPINYLGLVALSSLAGLLLLFLAAQGVFGVALLEGHLARHFLGPSHQGELERRIVQLATTRAEVMAAVDDERRRIERDLHDGVQQRLVALGMLLGRARRSRDPERADRLLLQAHDESRRALAELRDVAWRIHPTVLDEAGLRAALETVAERTPLPLALDYTVAGTAPLARTVQTVAYFVVSEAVTNVVKHSGATRIGVSLTRDRAAGPLRLRVEDDGRGGADPSGGGLTGLASRVAALDGRFAVHSPPGGPTVVTAELPCA
ncbi:sensor histidine kinase [Streptomyces sp. NBC_01619]|uniref:Sensor histidine kinase n=1 Tax=Streptomyces pratisoli TaxID=3139917 RepID=A0ACC6QEU1_9ACTN|nr:sensor histidine kinase [Streptomyces sp. NBC_01619]MCX4509285.1 sensor histidine kinase [Streptomyces sp. NBC_01619]